MPKVTGNEALALKVPRRVRQLARKALRQDYPRIVNALARSASEGSVGALRMLLVISEPSLSASLGPKARRSWLGDFLDFVDGKGPDPGPAVPDRLDPDSAL